LDWQPLLISSSYVAHWLQSKIYFCTTLNSTYLYFCWQCSYWTKFWQKILCIPNRSSKFWLN